MEDKKDWATIGVNTAENGRSLSLMKHPPDLSRY